jgi:hypothetical protein
MSYLSPQRLASLSNEELADLHSSLVLVRFAGGRRKDLVKFVQTLEYLMLRRLHSLSCLDLAKIIHSYGHLIRQRKVPHHSGNTSLIKTMEYVLQNKWSSFSDSED